MFKLSKTQASTIQTLIYPQTQKIDRKFLDKNKNEIKKIQYENKTKKEEKENFIPNEPFKLKEFKNVGSKLKQMINNNQREREQERKKNPSLSKNYNTNPIPLKKSKSINQFKTINNKTIEQPQGIVKNQIVRKEEENIFAILNTNQDDDFPHLRKLKQMQKEKSLTPIERNRKEFESVQNNLQDSGLNEIRLPQMRNTKNFIEENKNKIQNKEILKKSAKKEEIDSAVHKNFGKTPEYLQKYKKDAEDKKEFLKRKAEEAKYPKGTRLISEEERLETLHSLENSKKEIITLLEKMPISMKTITLQNRKTELEKKLDEIEDAIRTFSRKQVFIKIDN